MSVAGVQAQPQVLIRVCVEPKSQQVTFTSEYVSLGKQMPLATHVERRPNGSSMQHRDFFMHAQENQPSMPLCSWTCGRL